MLNWNKIDNDKTFQRLVNHLVSLECNSPYFIPSSPYISADGAFDGYFTGPYPRENITGAWSIQSKWTTKSGKEAARYLSHEIKEELEKSQKKNVEHLRIATNAELTKDQVESLQEISANTSLTLQVWHRENLTIRIERQPFIRHYFFGSPQNLKFVPWNVYFAQLEPYLLTPSDLKIQRFDDYLSKAKEFIRSAEASVLLIHSPGGYGKSHLLRSIAQIAHETNPATQPWMMKGGVRSAAEAIDDELISGRRYLIILDDADRFLEEVKPILAYARNNRDFVKVILSIRSSGLRRIRQVVSELRIDEFTDQIPILEWEKQDLIRLLRSVAEQDSVPNEELISTLYPNPFQIVWIGRLISKQQALDFNKIKQKFVSEIDYEAGMCLSIEKSSIQGFLINLACVVPFPQEDRHFLSAFAQFSKIDESHVADSLDRLVQSGILRVVGSNLRFNQDMIGDLYLAYQLEMGIDGHRVRQLLRTWIGVCSQKLLINIESAARYGNIPYLKESLSPIVRSWAEGKIDPFSSRTQVLDALEKIASIVPEDAVGLLLAYLQPSVKGTDKGLNRQSSLTTDDYGPVVSQLIGIPDLRDKILETIHIMDTSDIEGTYDNYKPKSLIRFFVSPLHNATEQIIKTLASLEKWLDAPDHSRIGLLSAALQEVLSGSHEYTEATIGGFTFGERVLHDTPEIRKMRDQALQIVGRMLNHSLLEANLSSIEVASAIGRIKMQTIQQTALPLSGRIREERKEITARIGSLIRPDLNFNVMNRIERLFLVWWAQLTPGTDEAEQYLDKIPRSPEYQAFCYYVSDWLPVKSFAELKKDAPSEDKWKWFVHRQMRGFTYSSQDLNDLVGYLNQRYFSEDLVLRFLEQLDKDISQSGEWVHHPPIVSCWIKMTPGIFLSINGNDRFQSRIPERFRDEIRSTLAELDERVFLKLMNEIFSELPDTPISKVHMFLTCLKEHPLKELEAFSNLTNALDRGESEKGALIKLHVLCVLDRTRLSLLTVFRKGSFTTVTLYRCLSSLLSRGSSKVRCSVLFHLDSLAERMRSTYLPVQLLRLAMSRDRELSSEMIFNLSLIVLRKGEKISSAPSKVLSAFREDLLNRLKNSPRLDYWSQELLDFACCDVDTLADFIESRIQKSVEAEWDKYEPIPLDGIPVIGRFARSYSEYEKLMEKMTAWCNRGIRWRLSLKQLMRPIGANEDLGKSQQYLQEFVEKKLRQGEIAKAIVACEFLDLNESTVGTFTQVAEQAIMEGKTREVENLLHNVVFPRAGWSSALGQDSPELVSRKRLFEKMKSRTESGRLSIILEDCIRSLNMTIQRDREADQEMLTPRG